MMALVLSCLLVILLSGCSTKEGEAPKPIPKTMSAEKDQSGDSQETLTTIKSRGELRVGLQVGYPPFEMLDSGGKLIGFDVEAASMIAADLKVELRLARLNWTELIPMLRQGQIDIIISGMTVTPERNIEIMFTNPVVETGRMFLVHKTNSDRFKQIRDLNLTGVFVASIPGGKGALDIGSVIPKAAFREFPDRKTATAEIAEKRSQAYIDEEFAIKLLCANKPNVFFSRFEPLNYEFIAWGVRPGAVHWLNWLNNFIIKIQGDGRLDSLKKRWLHDSFLETRTSFKNR